MINCKYQTIVDFYTLIGIVYGLTVDQYSIFGCYFSIIFMTLFSAYVIYAYAKMKVSKSKESK